MKKAWSFFWRILPHLTLILSLVLLTLFVLDCLNEAMAFLNNSLTKRLVCIFSLFVSILSVTVIVRRENDQNKE